MSLHDEGGPKAAPEAAAAKREARREPNPHEGQDVQQALSEIRRWETAARLVADDSDLTIRAKCKALLEMMAKARRSELAAFLEVAVWRGCRHLFEGDRYVPRDVIEANRRLLRRPHDRCPECRRPLPSTADLDRWRELGHDLGRPA